MTTTKLPDHLFKALVNQVAVMDEQINDMQDFRKTIITQTSGATVQAYYMRKKKLGY